MNDIFNEWRMNERNEWVSVNDVTLTPKKKEKKSEHTPSVIDIYKEKIAKIQTQTAIIILTGPSQNQQQNNNKIIIIIEKKNTE